MASDEHARRTLHVSPKAVTALVFLLAFGVAFHFVSTIWLWQGASEVYEPALHIVRYIGLVLNALALGGLIAAWFIHRTRKENGVAL